MNLDELYKQYKERLHNNFIVIGDPNLSGTNIPASIKHRWAKNGTILHWGDSTIMLGHYIATLATEYHLNENSETLNELKNALSTLERLDKVAENAFDVKLPKNKLNGFFIRDDVKSYILERYPFLKNGGIKSIVSSFEPYDYGNGKDTSRDKEMSQDQFWHLILGLSLVIKLVDDIFCVKIAQDFVDRVMSFIKKNKFIIINPVTGKKVKRGMDVRIFSYGFCKASNFITPKVNPQKYWKKYNFLNKFGFIITRFGQRILERLNINYENYPYLALSTVGDIGINKDMSYITWHLNKYGYFEHFPLIYNILHDKGDISKYKQGIEDLLSKAPLIHYNYYKSTGDMSIPEWSSPNRLIAPENLAEKNIHFNGEYNGIDFMLLYNLYKIAYK